MMKRFLLFVAFFALFCSCTKDNDEFQGYFTYKLSGTIYLEEIIQDQEEEAPTPQKLTLNINSENGQLSLLSREKGSSDRVITMSSTGGFASIGTANIVDKHLSISILNRDTMVYDNEYSSPFGDFSGDNNNRNVLKKSFDFTGEGEIIDKMLLIYFTASGQINYKDKDYIVTSSKIECIARNND